MSDVASGGKERLRSLQRERWNQAWKRLASASHMEKAVKTRVQALPLAIRTQGLGVAVAVLMREGKRESEFLANELASWLLRECPVRVLGDGKGAASPRELLKLIAESQDPVEVGAATGEAIAFVGAMKLLASALSQEGA